MRKHFLDNIRWATVLLVLVYHVFYMFNAAGVLGGVGAFAQTQYQDALLYFVYPWFMVLLFVVAGISAKYALDKATCVQFLKSRTRKLLVPSTLGLFVFQWMVGYFNVKIGGGSESIPAVIRYLVFALSGIGPLWFAQTLWLFSVVLVLFRKLDPSDRLHRLCGKYSAIFLAVAPLLLWGGAQILNLPVLVMYRFGIYFIAFLLGYFVLSHERIQAQAAQIHLPMLAIAVAVGIAYTIFYFGSNYTEDACLHSLFTNLYAWLMVLAILGCGKAWFDNANGISTYLTKSSFGIYVVHYLFVPAPCYFLKTYTQLPAALIYVLALAIVLVCSPLCYELLRRIPVVRYLVLGIGSTKKAPTHSKK